MDRKQKQKMLVIAAKKLVVLGDDPGIFMTCESGNGTKPCIRLGCQNLKHAQDVHAAIIDIVNAARDLMSEPWLE